MHLIVFPLDSVQGVFSGITGRFLLVVGSFWLILIISFQYQSARLIAFVVSQKLTSNSIMNFGPAGFGCLVGEEEASEYVPGILDSSTECSSMNHLQNVFFYRLTMSGRFGLNGNVIQKILSHLGQISTFARVPAAPVYPNIQLSPKPNISS